MPARRLQHIGTIEAAASVRAAAMLMAEGSYSSLVVTVADAAVGVLTDGDLAMRVVAEGSDGGGLAVRDVMSHPPVTVSPDESYADVVAKLSAHRVRQLPLVADGELRGMVSLDDLIEILAGEFDDLAMAVRHEIWLTRIGEPDSLKCERQIQKQLGWRPRDRFRRRPL
ncbi:MAG: CBS domain-containing protein [Planctomycetes bacterium]|nr:CBS domain-containing protein [Planctomycetota bacterium]